MRPLDGIVTVFEGLGAGDKLLVEGDQASEKLTYAQKCGSF